MHRPGISSPASSGLHSLRPSAVESSLSSPSTSSSHQRFVERWSMPCPALPFPSISSISTSLPHPNSSTARSKTALPCCSDQAGQARAGREQARAGASRALRQARAGCASSASRAMLRARAGREQARAGREQGTVWREQDASRREQGAPAGCASRGRRRWLCFLNGMRIGGWGAVTW
jgi:hypothetical protein